MWREVRWGPVTLIIFDVLHSGSEDLTGRPYVLRRALLEDLGLQVPGSVQVPPAFPGDAGALLEVTRAQGLEGIVLKRPASRYHPGRRTREWLKIRNIRAAQVRVGRGGDLPGTHVVRPAPSAGLAGPEAGLAASSCPSQTLALTGVTARRRTTVSLSRWPSGAAPCPRCRNERADPGRGPDCRTAARGSTTAPQVTTWTSWHRWTAISLLAYAFLAVSSAWQRTLDGSAASLGLIPVTVPELLRQLRGTVIPEPRRDKPHRDAWALWRRRHQYEAQRAHQRWNPYADEPPR